MSATQTWQSRWPSFEPAEVLSPDGLRALARGVMVVQPAALDFLQRFRRALEKPILVNHGGHMHRGYRSPAENKSVGGEEFSYHMQGLAFDLTVPGMTVDKLFDAARTFGWHGIGRYPTRGFVHCDLRAILDENVRHITWTL